jgi:transposase
MRTKLGTPKAITAAAHKLARIIYLLTTRKLHEESMCAQHEAQYQQLEARLRKQAQALGFGLTAKQNCTT